MGRLRGDDKADMPDDWSGIWNLGLRRSLSLALSSVNAIREEELCVC